MIQLNEVNTWGSHEPVLKAACQVLPHSRIIEFGIGKFSTPILFGAADKFCCVEHDWTWFAQVATTLALPVGKTITACVHTLPYGNIHLLNVPPEHQDVAASMYGPSGHIAHFVKSNGPYDIMFIDGVSATRNAVCGSDLPELANCVVMHDTEDWVWETYGWIVLRRAHPNWRWFNFRMPNGAPDTDICFPHGIDDEVLERLRQAVSAESVIKFGESRPFTERPTG